MRIYVATVRLVAAWAAVNSFACGETVPEAVDTETESRTDSATGGEPDGGEADGGEADGGDSDGQTALPSGNFSNRVRELISRMTLEEKVSQMGHYTPAIERLGIPKYNWWNEALHGVAFSGKATVFPQDRKSVV